MYNRITVAPPPGCSYPDPKDPGWDQLRHMRGGERPEELIAGFYCEGFSLVEACGGVIGLARSKGGAWHRLLTDGWTIVAWSRSHEGTVSMSEPVPFYFAERNTEGTWRPMAASIHWAAYSSLPGRLPDPEAYVGIWEPEGSTTPAGGLNVRKKKSDDDGGAGGSNQLTPGLAPR